MYHELVLHGIGGATVEQAKANLSVTEVRRWTAFVARYGSLNVARRIGEGCGMVAFVTNRGLGGKAALSDFIPHLDSGSYKSIDEVFSVLKGNSEA